MVNNHNIYLPDLEVDRQTPLGHEGTVTRMRSKLFDAGL